MTWEIEIIRQIKNDVVIVDKKDKFEHVLQTTKANATAIASPDYLNLSAFHRS